MIYFDNAATTFPKPQSVTNAVATAMRSFGANPGRSGHSMSLRAAEEVYRPILVTIFVFYTIRTIL